MDPDPRKEIEVDPDPDLDPERGLKWIRIRPNAVDPGGSGSETLVGSIYDNIVLEFNYFKKGAGVVSFNPFAKVREGVYNRGFPIS